MRVGRFAAHGAAILMASAGWVALAPTGAVASSPAEAAAPGSQTAPSATGYALPAALRLTGEIEHYDVPASNLADFVAVMQARKAEGDGDWPGRTRATLQVAYRLVPVDDGCRIDDLDVALHVAIRLPRWEPADAVRPEIRDQWARMKAGIRAHEQGHRDIAVAVAARLAERLAAFAPKAGQDCAAVDRRLLRERIKAQMTHQSRDHAYDRRTRHGLTQVPDAPAPRRRGG